MKTKIRLLTFAIVMAVSFNVFAQQTDPTLTGTVAAQTEMLKKIFKNREKTQNQIIAAEASVALAMERMHYVENKALEYLQNAQGAMNNLYQIKRAT